MSQRYRALRIIAWFYRILALLSIAGGVLTFVFAFTSSESDKGAGFAALAGGIIGGVIFLGIVELFELFMDIEENTRANAAATRQLLKVLSREK